jgi:hypothetical protein
MSNILTKPYNNNTTNNSGNNNINRLTVKIITRIIIMMIIIIIITNTIPQWIRTQTHLTTSRVAIPLSYQRIENIWRQYSTYK